MHKGPGVAGLRSERRQSVAGAKRASENGPTATGSGEEPGSLGTADRVRDSDFITIAVGSH